jgi:hypothetical protein
MSQEAVIIRFPGDPKELARKYAAGIRQFREAHPEIHPAAIFLGQSDQTPDGLTVVVLWPEGVSHEILGHHLLKALGNLGLPRPSSADHLAIGAVGWDAVAAIGEG